MKSIILWSSIGAACGVAFIAVWPLVFLLALVRAFLVVVVLVSPLHPLSLHLELTKGLTSMSSGHLQKMVNPYQLFGTSGGPKDIKKLHLAVDVSSANSPK